MPVRAPAFWAEEPLLEVVYEVPFGGGWTPLLDALTSRLGVANADVVMVARDTGEVTLHRSSDLDPEVHAQYRAYYGRLDPLLLLAASRPEGEWLSSAAIADLPWRGTEYVDDFVHRHGIEHIGGLSVVDDAGS